jgi:hypothetical protein
MDSTATPQCQKAKSNQSFSYTVSARSICVIAIDFMHDREKKVIEWGLALYCASHKTVRHGADK